MTDIPTLMFETPPGAPTSFNVLLFGPTGSGKSTAAATAPGPILWLNTQGAGALAHPRKVAAERGTKINEVKLNRQTPNVKEVLRQFMDYIRTAEGDEAPRTVVIDMLADLRSLLIRQIVVPGASNSIQQFGQVADLLLDMVLWLRDRDINVVILCHPELDTAEDVRTERPMIGGAITEKIPAEMDIVGFTHVFRDEEGGVRYVAQLVEGRGRVAKNRGGVLGAIRDLDLSEWLDAYTAGLTPKSGDLPFDENPPGPSQNGEKEEKTDDIPFPSAEEAEALKKETASAAKAKAKAEKTPA